MSPAPCWTIRSLPARIVVGVDGSPASLSALRWAASEAQQWDAEVTAVRSWQDRPAPCVIAAWQPPLDHEREDARRALARDVQAVLGPESAARVHQELAYGHPARSLLHLAAKAAVLVLGDTPTDRGPVRTACLRMAPCPVVLVPPDPLAPIPTASRRPTARASD